MNWLTRHVIPHEFFASCFYQNDPPSAVYARAYNCVAPYAFIQHLLHNIGILALNQVMPYQYDLVVQDKMSTQCSWHEAETKILGFDHALFGHYLVQSWGLPRRFSIPIRHHHAPDVLADD
ncbi:MAG: HDOD domain-containing protein, partial [Desulfovermiculus sp.]|nr:HDOD domain-containing protein [Desulfovermiculus sp.]